MTKKVVRLTENQFKNAIFEAAQAVLNEPMTSVMESPSLVIEMARINKKEGGRGIFPYNSFVVKIWSNDHEPAHFHVMKDGWNLLFEIATGNLMRVEDRGRNVQDYNYITENVKEWLQSQCAITPSLTNQENAMAVWEQLHDDE